MGNELTVWYCLIAEKYPFERLEERIRGVQDCLNKRIPERREAYALHCENAELSAPEEYEENRQLPLDQETDLTEVASVPYENLILTYGNLAAKVRRLNSNHLLIIFAADWDSDDSYYAQGMDRIAKQLELLKSEYQGRLQIAIIYEKERISGNSIREYFGDICDYVNLEGLATIERMSDEE